VLAKAQGAGNVRCPFLGGRGKLVCFVCNPLLVEVSVRGKLHDEDYTLTHGLW